MDNTALLRAFPYTDLIGIVRHYTDGQSGATVLAVNFRSSGVGGLEGTYIVKIGTEDWGASEEAIYSELTMNTQQPVLARFVARTPRDSEGKCAVAYELAFNNRTRTETLAELIDEGSAHTRYAAQYIRVVASAFVDWNIGRISRSICSPREMLIATLGAERWGNLHARLRQCLPEWDQDTSHIQIEGLQRLLPNPFLWTGTEATEGSDDRWIMPTGLLHGDLHAGNIVCVPGIHRIPKVIDFGQHRTNANAFFDLAYLEFDIIRRTLPVGKQRYREQWISLLEYAMRSILPANRPKIGFDAERTWALIRPIRQQAKRLQQAEQGLYCEDFEIAWWVAAIAVGLNFARKGGEHRHREPMERVAALLYASFAFERLLALLGNPRTNRRKLRQGVSAVLWLGESDEKSLSSLRLQADKREIISWNLPGGVTQAAERAQARFLKAYQKQFEAVNLESLAVLIWRPSITTSSTCEKARDAIRKLLTQRGFFAFFSDDSVIAQYRNLPDHHAQQVALARSVDLIVMLVEDNAEVIEQAYEFCRNWEAAPNVFALVPERLKHSAPLVMRLLDHAYGGVVWYGEDDDNWLVDRAIERAEARRLVSVFVQGAQRADV